MTTTTRVFVPDEEIQKISKGSYERQIGRLIEAATPTLDEVFQGVDWDIVATYASHIIAVAKDGKAVRLRYEDVNGRLCVFPEGNFALKTTTAPEYITAKAKSAVSAFRVGSVTEAKELISDLILLAPAKRYSTDSKVTDAVVENLNRDLTWKQRYRAERSKFLAFIGEERLAQVPTLAPKFGGLTENTIETADQSTYYQVVQEAFTDISGRFEKMTSDLEDALKKLEASAPAIVALGESDILTSLDSFIQDLLNDVRSVHRVVSESLHQIGRVDNLGRIYDAVATNYNQYEVACRFVIEMTNSLSEASKVGE